MTASTLYLAADRLDELAAILRARAVLIGLHSSTVRWHSPAARAYLARLDDITATITGCTVRMNELADLARQAATAQ